MERLPTRILHFKNINRLNMEQLQDLLDIDDDGPQVIGDLILIFEETCREKIPKIKSSAQSLDLPALGKEMHSFKVSCYNIGALRASVIGKEIHRLSGQADISGEDLCLLIQELESEIESALVEIHSFARQSSRRVA